MENTTSTTEIVFVNNTLTTSIWNSDSLELTTPASGNCEFVVNDTSLQICKEPEYYSLPFTVIATVFYILVGLIGFIGNAMVIVVVLKVKGMRSPTNCYLVSLAIGDSTLSLISTLLHSLPELYLPNVGFPYGIFGCRLFIFLEYLSYNSTALSITAFTVERFIAICYPMRSATICTNSRAIRIISAIWIFTILYCLPWLIFVRIVETQYVNGHDPSYYCQYMDNKELLYKTIYMLDFALFYVMPTVVCSALYTAIGVVLHRSTSSKKLNKNMDVNTKSGNGTGVTECDTNANSHVRDRKNFGTKKSIQKKKQSKRSAVSSRKQVVKMLVVVVALFVMLWGPYRILNFYTYIWDPTGETMPNLFPWWMFFIRILVFLNSAINPLIYNFMSVKFRRAFAKLCRCGGILCICSSHTHVGQSSHFRPVSTKSRMSLRIKENDRHSRKFIQAQYVVTRTNMICTKRTECYLKISETEEFHVNTRRTKDSL
ncbi:thyrotropin-releasing hormone receptor-like [Anneissia japonica]|uniref:thyrotropin-releasing hormone receptor-like n=1 Tax=Anneissia japonica TaxID=1529436 RepID=UPI0014257876|nr:thyrotropin-releasing hormone receptor-like [Anneissia japonica]